VDYTDRTTCILFGDGASAVWVEAQAEKTIYGSLQGAEGDKGKELYLSTSGHPVNETEIIANGFLHQDGRKVFRWAVGQISKYAQQVICDAGLKPEDIDWFIPHSANMRIIEALAKNVGIPVEKTLESVSVYGNTSSASIPLAMARGLDSGKLKKGDKVLAMGFGGGLSYAGIIFEWQGA
ncbi:MAG: 3-oxoacyl-[acyl-carrier-protein] synthase III C-terminal domain-containing protein, partial [Bacteroidota bacterium]